MKLDGVCAITDSVRRGKECMLGNGLHAELPWPSPRSCFASAHRECTDSPERLAPQPTRTGAERTTPATQLEFKILPTIDPKPGSDQSGVPEPVGSVRPRGHQVQRACLNTTVRNEGVAAGLPLQWYLQRNVDCCRWPMRSQVVANARGVRTQ